MTRRMRESGYAVISMGIFEESLVEHAIGLMVKSSVISAIML